MKSPWTWAEEKAAAATIKGLCLLQPPWGFLFWPLHYCRLTFLLGSVYSCLSRCASQHCRVQFESFCTENQHCVPWKGGAVLAMTWRCRPVISAKRTVSLRPAWGTQRVLCPWCWTRNSLKMSPRGLSYLWNLPFPTRETTILWGNKKRSGLEARRFRDSSHHLLCGPRQTSQPFCSTVPTGKIELLTCCHSPTRSAFDLSVSKRDNRC